jgi:hypothetical protein
MRFMTNYTNIVGFLKRFTLLQVGSLHIRIHSILGNDVTNFMHNHPFNYISVVLSGAYEEHYIDNNIIKIKHRAAPAIIVASHSRFHRIHKVEGKCKTLFIAYGKYKWRAMNMSVPNHPDGMYVRVMNNERLHCKRINDIWYIGNSNRRIAMLETRHSIHQY